MQKARDQRSNIVIDNLVSSRVPVKPMANENYYGYEDTDAISSISSQSSSNEAELQRAFPSQQQRSSSVTSILKKPNQNSPTNRHVTIRDDRPSPSSQSQRSVSFREAHDDTQQILQDYQQILREHPDVYHDPNPEIITKNNPDHLSYQQNVSVRYLVPPTPPPPGPLIIRGRNDFFAVQRSSSLFSNSEIVPPRGPSPEPLVVRYQEPAPPTPPPLILREAPPPPPPRQEATVITKVLRPEPPLPRRVIVEHNPPVGSLSRSSFLLHRTLFPLAPSETSVDHHRKMAPLQTGSTPRSDLRTRRRRAGDHRIRSCYDACHSATSSLSWVRGELDASLHSSGTSTNQFSRWFRELTGGWTNEWYIRSDGLVHTATSTGHATARSRTSGSTSAVGRQSMATACEHDDAVPHAVSNTATRRLPSTDSHEQRILRRKTWSSTATVSI